MLTLHTNPNNLDKKAKKKAIETIKNSWVLEEYVSEQLQIFIQDALRVAKEFAEDVYDSDLSDYSIGLVNGNYKLRISYNTDYIKEDEYKEKIAELKKEAEEFPDSISNYSKVIREKFQELSDEDILNGNLDKIAYALQQELFKEYSALLDNKEIPNHVYENYYYSNKGDVYQVVKIE